MLLVVMVVRETGLLFKNEVCKSASLDGKYVKGVA